MVIKSVALEWDGKYEDSNKVEFEFKWGILKHKVS